ncbi:inclusion body family protein [Pectobacterium parvum]|uniref:Inclusion body family protein n=1 Tax=Pectobacterium parvum TaxID=2778550 RepID=A0ABW8FTV1_9GAMM|nr:MULTISPECIES: inclusion body family protein [Pectobacterium]UFK37672.1 inclusion body family protein [Pectobacterium parvum]UVD95768.1 inclusion body family protein [Pectobacterium parvum]GKW40494.1 hypothetical protein PEC301879_03530 [Pectobacterium carotovorum subsp. carotovorum]
MSEINPNDTRSSHNVINVTVVIDTDLIISKFIGRNASQDQKKPTQIGHEYSYMVATNKSVIKGSGTADLNIKANVGDVIRWTGVSESNNFDSSVLIYDLPKFGGTHVFTDAAFKMYTKKSMLPKPGSTGPFPVKFEEQSNWFIQADITKAGTEKYQVQFGVYYRPEGGEQKLFGYFQWDPTITVSN